MRHLASIQKIWKIEPIEGADRIELIHVCGWQCVANKGQFKPMDNAIYFEIDSFLPIRPEFEFLRSSSYKKTDIMGEGFRLRTMRFKGQISQGLVLPLSVFPELNPDTPVGTDVSQALGVKKWEVEERATTQGTIIGTLPPSIPTTDETRAQECPELIQDFGDLEYYISSKMDGTSCSVAIDDDGWHVCGHHYEYADDGKSSFYNFINNIGLREKMEKYVKEMGYKTLVIQGEFCAPGIQKNPLKLVKPEWYVFTVRVDNKRVGLIPMQTICHELGLTHVPIEEVANNLSAHYPTVEALLARAEQGTYPSGSMKEGIVIRPTEPVYCPRISASLSMKVVSNKYLLKKGE